MSSDPHNVADDLEKLLGFYDRKQSNSAGTPVGKKIFGKQKT